MSKRIDLEIPDEVFEIQSLNNGQKRTNAVRDFYREWIYFCYPLGDGAESNGSWIYPVQSLLFNYRDNTWAILRENITHQGTFRKSVSYTWAHPPYPTWATWQEPWNAGSSQALFPNVIAGNPQGFVYIKGEGTSESISGYISAITSTAGGFTQITSYNHCVNSGANADDPTGDYLSFGGPSIGLVTSTIDANNFVVDILSSSTASITNVTPSHTSCCFINFSCSSSSTKHKYLFVGQTVSLDFWCCWDDSTEW